MPKIRNIIIFIAIAGVFVLIYIYFIKPPAPTDNLITTTTTLPSGSTTGATTSGVASSDTTDATGAVAADFLALLLNVKNIKLDDSIFSNPAFNSLHDSSITLTPDGTEGRPNPFAQFGNDSVSTSPNTTNLPNPPAPSH